MEPLIVSYRPTKFGGHGHCGSGSIMVLVCHMILQDHVSKASGNFMGRSHPAKFGGHSHCGREIKWFQFVT